MPSSASSPSCSSRGGLGSAASGGASGPSSVSPHRSSPLPRSPSRPSRLVVTDLTRKPPGADSRALRSRHHTSLSRRLSDRDSTARRRLRPRGPLAIYRVRLVIRSLGEPPPSTVKLHNWTQQLLVAGVSLTYEREAAEEESFRLGGRTERNRATPTLARRTPVARRRFMESVIRLAVAGSRRPWFVAALAAVITAALVIFVGVPGATVAAAPAAPQVFQCNPAAGQGSFPDSGAGFYVTCNVTVENSIIGGTSSTIITTACVTAAPLGPPTPAECASPAGYRGYLGHHQTR